MVLDYSHLQTIIVLVSLTLGYIVWTYNSKSYLNRILTFIILCILLIEISLLLHLKIEGRRFLHSTVILGSLGISFFTPLLYTLSLYYPIKKDFQIRHLLLIYGISMILSILIILSFPEAYLIEKISLPSDIRNISLKNLPVTFVILYFLLTSFSILLLILSTKNFLLSFKGKIIPYEKRTVQMLIVFGFPLAYLLSIVSVINYFFNIPFPWIGFFFTVFTLFLVILIFRFHLVDLRRIMNGILFFPSIIAILVFIYISLILKNQNKIAAMLELPESVALILEVFIIYMVVSTLRRLLDISFLQKKFPNVPVFRTRSIEPFEYLSFATSIKDLNERLREVFRVYIKIDRVFMLLLDREKQRYENEEDNDFPVLSKGNELIKVLSKLNRGVTLEELLIYINNREDIETLHKSGINLLLPIKGGDEILALILIPKRSIISRWSYEDIVSLDYIRVAMPSLIDRCIMYENEREIEKHESRMEQAVVMGQMASGLAHEIRNPLSIISTSVETILKNEIMKKDEHKMLRFIQEETERINILVNKLLSIDYQTKPELEFINIISIFTKLKTFLEYKLRNKNVGFYMRNNESCYLYTDPNLLFQIFLNLMLNSIEAVEIGGFISLDYHLDQGFLVILLRDDGPGMSDELRDKVFEPFFTTKKMGSGLGLTVTKKLVETLYGDINIMPSDKGACFQIKLPLIKD